MKVCILYSAKRGSENAFKELCDSLARGIGEQGATCDIFNINVDEGTKLSFYDYVIIGCDAENFFGGKISTKITSFLRHAGQVSGKRCMAFVRKGGIRSAKTLHVLMKLMEGEGMYLKTSDVIKKSSYANFIGTKLHIKNN